MLGKRSSRALVISSLLIASLFGGVAPARAESSYGKGGVAIGDVLGVLARAARPFAVAGRALGSWFDSTFLSSQVVAAPAQTPAVPGEVPWKRTRTSRTVRNPNGSYSAELSTHPINYLDSGVWQPIDNTLVTSTKLGYDWQNAANSFGVHLKRDLGDKAVALVLDGATYTLTPTGLSKVPGSRSEAEARYPNVAPNTDLTYRATETGIKEEITLRNASAPTEFKFLFQGPSGMTVVAQKDGSAAVKSQSGKPIFSFEAPWAAETLTGGRVAAVDPARRHVALAIKQVELPAGFELTLSVDKDWLSEAGRQFPVLVDPTIVIQPDQTQARETVVISSCLSPTCTSVTPATNLLVGTDASLKYRAMLGFDIQAIPFHSLVSAASLATTLNGCVLTCANAQTVEAREFLADWDSWAVPWDYADANYGGTVASQTKAAGQSTGTMTWSNAALTALVQAWINVDKVNNGILLRTSSEALGQGAPSYASSRFATASSRPKLTVTYTANANATSLYPADPPTGANTEVDLSNAFSNDPTHPLLPPSPARSLFRTGSDGTLMYLENDSCHRNMQAAKPPFQSWSAPVDLGCDADMQAFMRTDDSGTLYTITEDTLGRGVLKRFSRSGTSTTWTNDVTAVYDAALPTGASVVRAGSRVWIAYSKLPVGQTTPILILKSTDNEGTNFSGQTNLVRSNAAQLVPMAGINAGIVISRFSDNKLAWRDSGNWNAETVFADSTTASDPFQAVVDDSGRVHLVYQVAGGIRYRMRDAAGVWTPAAGSAGTTIAGSDTQPSISTDGSTLVLVTKDTSNRVVRRTWNGSWSAGIVTVTPSFAFGFSNFRGALPARLGANSGVIPYVWEEVNSSSPATVASHFDYLDSVAPGGSIPYPGEGEVLVGTITAQASTIDEVGVQRTDFFVDRGGSLIGFLGTDSTPSDGFTMPWNTRQTDGSGKKIWANGAYRVFAVAWDYKGNRGETNRPLSYVQDQDLGVRPYRPMLPIPIGAGVDAQVNLWNGNLTVSHGLLSDPTVIGPLSIARTYNSLDTQNGTAGRGWNAGADLDAEFSFAKLIDHAGDAEYPANVAELIETDGTPHWYLYSTGNSYAPFIDDYSVLVKNTDGTWTLTMADGGRYTFNSSGDPIEHRMAEQTLDQASFSYAYTSGKLSSILDPVGRGVTLTYDGNGRLWKVTSNQTSPARTWTLTYSATGELTDVQDPVNGAQTTHFDYDATSKLMTRVTTPAGVRIEFGYDSSSPKRVNEVRQIHTDGATVTYTTKVEYTDAQTTKVIRPKGTVSPCSTTPSCKAKYTTTFGMDARYRLTSVGITLPDGTAKNKTIAWNDQNLQTSASSFAGQVSSSTYDRAGNLLTQTMPDPDAGGPLTASMVQYRYDEPYQGLQGWYYNDTALTPPAVLRRLDSTIAFTWSGSPGSGVNSDNFSVRWIGYIDAPTLGAYTFYTTSDLASRLYVDGRELIDNWTTPVGTERASAPITLASGLHPVTLEMRDTTGSAAMTLAWQGPAISKQTIPSARLRPGFNLQTSSVDELGNVTSNLYEDETPPNYTNDQDPFYGRLIEQTQTNTPVGGSAQTLRSTFIYNSFGQRTSKTMPKGNTGGSPDPVYTTTYTYYGSSENATDPCTSTSYPQLGLLKSVAQPGLATKTQVHDGAGNIIALTEGKGTMCSAFDGLSRQTSLKASDRATATNYGYDRDGRRTIVADPTMPAVATYTFDDLGRLKTAKDALAPVTEAAVTYSYDEHSNLTSRVDKTGTTGYTLDELDRVTQLTDPALRVYSFTHDPDGKLLQQNYPNATKAVPAYDNADRLTAYRNQTSAGAPLAEYVYTYNSRAEKLTEDGPQGIWAYTYDAIGRLEQAHDPTSGRTRRYMFDLNSNRTEVRLNKGWATSKIANGWSAAPIPPPVAQTWNGTQKSFQYALGFNFPFFGATYSSAWISTSGYLTLGSSTGSTGTTLDLVNASFPAIAPYARDLTVSTPTDSISVAKNAAGARIRWKARVTGTSQIANFEVYLASDGTITFNYQNMPASGTARVGITPGNRVDFVAVPGFDRVTLPSSPQTVVLTPVNESVQASYTYNALDQLTGGTGLSGINYSLDGEQTSITGPSPRGAWTFDYDGRELMRSAATGGGTTAWTLDGEGRVVKEIKSGVETRYRFAGPGDGPSWEENTTGTVTTSQISEPNGLLASYAGGVPTFQIMNGHGDVIQTRSLSGGLLDSYAYAEGGQPSSNPEPTKYGYAGKWQKQREPDSSLLRLGLRMFDPFLGRFTSWDPVEHGSLNGYDYAAQDPINVYDLDGTRAVAGDDYNNTPLTRAEKRLMKKRLRELLSFYRRCETDIICALKRYQRAHPRVRALGTDGRCTAANILNATFTFIQIGAPAAGPLAILVEAIGWAGNAGTIILSDRLRC